MKSNHPIDRYMRKHGHAPRIRVDNGVQKLTISFARGYVHIKTSSPFAGEVYITAGTVRTLIKHHRHRILRLVRLQDQNFDVPKRVQASAVAEREHLEALRQQKKVRHFDTDAEQKRQRQRQRYLAAQARSQAKKQD